MNISHLLAALILTAPLLSPAVSQAAISFTSTADGKPLSIPAESFDTPVAKNFLATGKNGYIGDAAAVKAGKKVYQLYSCAQCHGPAGDGQVGPNLRDDTFNYAKNATDQGMFETLWGGTPAGMGAKGKGLMLADDPSQGLTPNEVLQVLAFLRTKADVKPAEPAAANITEPAKEAAPVAAAAPVETKVVKSVKKTTKKTTKKSVKKVKKV